MPFQDELETALHDHERYEALALVDMTNDHLLFLKTTDRAAPGMARALEEFLLRVITDTESHQQLNHTEEIVFYDIQSRQLICLPVNLRQHRYLLALLISPGKTYKQAAKRLVKNLKTLLPPP